MTDYLEELEEQAEALEEDRKRLEEALAGLEASGREAEYPEGEEPSPPAPLLRRGESPGEDPVRREEGALPAGAADRTEPRPAEGELPALLSQTTALEEALAGLGAWMGGTGDQSAGNPARGDGTAGETGTIRPGAFRTGDLGRTRSGTGTGAGDLRTDREGTWNGETGLDLFPPGGSVGRNGLPAREIAWDQETMEAQRVDRVFRRDSRRYDGGFFLY